MIQLRPAGFSDLKFLQRWDKAPHVIAANGTEDWSWQTELHRQTDWREQLIAEVEGTPVGFLQIIDPAQDWEPLLGRVPRWFESNRYLDW